MPALIPSARAHALPGDATNVRIDMTENDGLDVIVAASGGGVSAPGVPERGGRAVPPDRGDVGGRHRPGVRRPVDPGGGEPDHPDGIAGRVGS